MFLYPQEIIADIYVSRIGGFSPELEKREAGINSKAIEMNTSIIADETYARLKFLDEKPYPFFLKKKYRIVGLEENMEGYEESSNGEVVLSYDLKDELEQKVGSEVIINTVETFRLGDETSAIEKILGKTFKINKKTRENY
ncbi:MAG TPA: hypothetical protein EYP30_06330 [Archaeoglobaceae archaeon]|nr:hypothetical protein [Archaeoglobaceae archaeon]